MTLSHQDRAWFCEELQRSKTSLYRLALSITGDPEDAAEAEQMVTALMGDRVEARKEFLAQNANFNKVDTFIDRVNI